MSLLLFLLLTHLLCLMVLLNGFALRHPQYFLNCRRFCWVAGNDRLNAVWRDPANRRSFEFLAGKIRELNRRSAAFEIARVITQESRLAGYDPIMVAALIDSESSFRSSVSSSKGARGLMQLLPSTAEYIAERRGWAWLGLPALFKAEYNVKLGIAYLMFMEQMFGGDQRLALMAYNWGPTNLKTALRQQGEIFKPVQRYAARVLDRRRRWAAELQRLG